jgi:hypothetical protein
MMAWPLVGERSFLLGLGLHADNQKRVLEREPGQKGTLVWRTRTTICAGLIARLDPRQRRSIPKLFNNFADFLSWMGARKVTIRWLPIRRGRALIGRGLVQRKPHCTF